MAVESVAVLTGFLTELGNGNAADGLDPEDGEKRILQLLFRTGDAQVLFVGCHGISPFLHLSDIKQFCIFVNIIIIQNTQTIEKYFYKNYE